MSKLIVENTSVPFGIEKSGGVTYLKVLLMDGDTNHEYIKNRVTSIEQNEFKKLGLAVPIPIISNVRALKDGNSLLKIRINYFKGRDNIKMNYEPSCPKESYLSSVDDIKPENKINVKFSIGKPYSFMANGAKSFGLNIYVSEITIR